MYYLEHFQDTDILHSALHIHNVYKQAQIFKRVRVLEDKLLGINNKIY